MALIITFLLGIANFAMQRGVLECGHPALDLMPAAMLRHGARWAMAAEFLVLVGALYLVALGETTWAWAYFGYSVVNGVAGWAIITRRM